LLCILPMNMTKPTKPDNNDDPFFEDDSSKKDEPASEEQIQLLLERLSTMASTDPARLEKLARIKRQIEDGTYYVSAEDLARKIIEDMESGKDPEKR
jgi:anti-sigma28 factor (negative regulator of flagellin synthesis)